MKANSFITGFISAALICGTLFVFHESQRSHNDADEMIAALEDPRLKERYMRAMRDMQKDALALKLQALAARAVFAEGGVTLRSDPGASLEYHIAAISEFLDSEGSWMENYVTFDMIAPVLGPTKERISAFLLANPEIAKMVETHRKTEIK
jgi:hypothetical protein